MSFTLDEIIELCREESLYHKKKADQELKEYFDNKLVDSHPSYMVGMNSGYYLAYQRLLKLLTDLKEDNDDKEN